MKTTIKPRVNNTPIIDHNLGGGKTQNWWKDFNKNRAQNYLKNKEEFDSLRNPTGESLPVWFGREDPNDPRDREVTQERVNIIRYRVAMTLMLTMARQYKKVERAWEGKVYHLWFPWNDANIYELREGNPPSDVDRPAHMKRLNLVIDVGVIPKPVWEQLLNIVRWQRRNITTKHTNQNQHLVRLYRSIPHHVLLGGK